MAITLAAVLSHPALQKSRPVLLAGDPTRRTVRWVHSSEIYNIAPLLRGGELLLTTGLGLATSDPEERRAYVRALAEREVAGVALELGDSFDEVPRELVEEARRLDLPLVVLRDVYPFVEVTEQINSVILDRSVARLRHADDISRALSLVLAERGGPEGLTVALGDLLDRPVVLADATGAVVAATASDSDAVLGAPVGSATVTAHGSLLGTLVVGGDPEDDLLRAALDRAPDIFAIEMLRGQREPLLTGRERRTILRLLLAGAPDGTELLAQHAGAAGIPADSRWVGVAVAPEAGRPAMSVARDLVSVPGARMIATELEATTYAALAVPRTGAQEMLARVRSLLDRNGGPVAALGPVVGIGAAGRSLRAAHQALALGPLAPAGVRLLNADRLVVERILSAVPDRRQLEDLVEEQLGALLRAPHTSGLLETIRCYLEAGGSKAATARALHLRRQSVHQRLARIEGYLGDIEDPTRQTALRLALAAYPAYRKQPPRGHPSARRS